MDTTNQLNNSIKITDKLIRACFRVQQSCQNTFQRPRANGYSRLKSFQNESFLYLGRAAYPSGWHNQEERKHYHPDLTNQLFA